MEEWDQIVEAVRSAGLSPLFSESRPWRDIPCLWADHVYEPSGQCFAKYLFTYIAVEQWQRWSEWDDDFVREVIEPVYFRQSNDIGWNIYWISVMPECQFYEMDIQQRITFSSNTEYTRNFIMPVERLADAIPIGHINARARTQELRDPAENWLRQLEPEALDFCLREFSQKAFDKYLNGEMHHQGVLRKTSDATPGKQLDALDTILIPQDFRPHYYPKAWTIPFCPVNLLYGPNGSGKTSLLSAIELAVTGEVRGPSAEAGSGGPVLSNVVLTAKTEDSGAVLYPPRGVKEKKRLEEQWYRGRSTQRPAPQLQNLFHQFNYLSVEETFLFANQQPDLSNIFSKILFGPETSNMWRNRNRYLDECGKNIANLEQLLAQLEKWNAELPNASFADEAAFRAYIAASGLALDPNGAPGDILSCVETVLAEYDKVKELAPIPTPEMLQKEYAVKRSLHNAQTGHRSAYQQAMNRLNTTISQLQDRIGTLRSGCQRERAVLSAFQAAEPLRKQFAFYVSALDAVEAYRETEVQVRRYKAELDLLIDHSNQYSATLQTPPPLPLEDIQREMRRLHQRDAELKEELEQLQSQIEQSEALQARHSQLLASLRSTGLKIYHLDHQRQTCPLCGTEGMTQEILLSHIEETSTEDSQRLQELYEKVSRIKDTDDAIELQLKRLGQEQIVVHNHRLALQAVHEHFPQIQTFADLQREIVSVQGKVSEIQGQLAKIGDFLKTELRESTLDAGISDILCSREKLQNQLLSAGIDFPKEVSDEELMQWLSHSQSQSRKELETQIGELQNAEDTLRQKAGQHERCEKKLKQLQQDFVRTESDLLRLEQMQSFWNHVESIAGHPGLSGEALQSVCTSIAAQAHSLMAYKEFQKAKENCQSTMELTRQKRDRCHYLQQRLQAISSPETYAEWFIQENIGQISQIFLTLHSPQEFSGLAQSKSGELVALRNGDSIPVSRMSTGQRTALVISVFFQMNLATPYAPKFLLLDEPVANIDDLNVLALMDFLRELVITHKRQIFFTTANRNVARLFRRKFSFLLQDFQELRFSRVKEQQLEIVRCTYDQNRLIEQTRL